MSGTGHQASGNRFRAQYPEVIAAALRREFPGYAVTLRRDGDEPRYELISRDGTNPVCLISPDVQEIWDELKGP